MVFAQPQWSFAVAREALDYGIVSGEVLLIPTRGRVQSVFLEIPTPAFTLIPKLFSPEIIEQARGGDMLQFYVEEVSKRWVLGIEQPDGPNFDLWYYTQSNTPSWVDLTLRRNT